MNGNNWRYNDYLYPKSVNSKTSKTAFINSYIEKNAFTGKEFVGCLFINCEFADKEISTTERPVFSNCTFDNCFGDISGQFNDCNFYYSDTLIIL